MESTLSLYCQPFEFHLLLTIPYPVTIDTDVMYTIRTTHCSSGQTGFSHWVSLGFKPESCAVRKDVQIHQDMQHREGV